MITNKLIDKIKINKTDFKTKLLLSNVAITIFLKGISVIISLLLVPVTLGYLTAYLYGIWLTISSIFTWINHFDIGLGNGLRNKLTESIAQGNKKIGKIYVSTTFFYLTLIVISVYLILLFALPFINWATILNSSSEQVEGINIVVITAFAFCCLNFILRIVGIIFTSVQKSYINDLITLLGNVVTLIAIILLKKYTTGSLLNASIAISARPILILIIAYFLTFYKYFKHLKPELRFINLSYGKDLMSLGFQFFILQISGLIIFGTSNIIISNQLGPEQVTPYNIAFRYFNVAIMLLNIILTPMWSASTDAYTRGDFDWIKRSMNKVRTIAIILTFGILGMIFFSNIAYRIWIGENIVIPLQLTITMGLYTIVILWSSAYSTILFGIGKLRVQLINTVLAALMFIPISLILSHRLGILGMTIALTIINLSGAILNPIQYSMIIRSKAKGIWNK